MTAHHAPSGDSATRAYRQLTRALARQAGAASGAGPSTGLPAWADAAAIVAVSLQLDVGNGGRPQLDVALADGVPGRSLPPRWVLPCGASLPLRARRAPRLLAQGVGAPGLRRFEAPRLNGTATALVRDQLAPDRLYLLTCGHVVAPNAGAHSDELIEVLLPNDEGGAGGTRSIDGRLAEWLPPMGGKALDTRIDAALVELLRSDAVALAQQGALLAAGIGGAARHEAPVSLRRRSTPLAGRLLIHWSGWVDLPAITPGVADYFLHGAVGYASSAPTEAGDSGAALWDAQDGLVGMHLGAIPDATPNAANAVMAPIGPVLDWFAVQPWLRSDPATLPAVQTTAGRSTPPQRPAGDRSPGETLLIVAKTLWAEAAGEGRIGMEAVAGVIGNRTRLRWRNKRDAAEVCLDHKQFSCWNTGSPLLVKMERVQRQPDAAWHEALDIAGLLLAGGLADCTDGATHYHASTMRRLPTWARDARPCRTIGRHLFYRDIR